MKSKLLVLALLAGGSLFARPRVAVGFGFGFGYPGYYAGYYAAPVPAPPPYAYVPAYPRPGYTWIGGYWYPYSGRYAWRAGYWARPPYRGAFWVGPRYYGHRYYPGYWRR